MLIPYKDLLAEARAGGYAVGYFEAWDIYSLEAVLDAAEAEGKPVILGFGGVMMEPGWFEDRGMERLGALGLATAKLCQGSGVVALKRSFNLFPGRAWDSGRLQRGYVRNQQLAICGKRAPDPQGGGGCPRCRRRR